MASVDVHGANVVPIDQSLRPRNSLPGVCIEVQQHQSGASRVAPRGVVAIDGNRESLKGSEQVVRVGLAPGDLHASPYGPGFGGER